jgi:hypothetical protein
MKKSWLWLISIFDANPDSPSTTRILAWLWTLTLCGGILFCIAFDAISKREVEMPKLDSSYIAITGIYLAAKVGQKIWGEPPCPTPPATPITPPPVVLPPKA